MAAVNQDFVSSKDELGLYLNRIGYPKSKELLLNLETLSQVLDCHLKAIPIGALSLNYYEKLAEPLARPVNILDPYSSKGVSLLYNDIFDRLVHQSREGLCFEQCILMRRMLEMIGFQVFIAGSHIFDPAALGDGREILLDLTHSVLVVTINSHQFLMDPGFAHFSTPSPVPLDGTPVASEGCLHHRVMPYVYLDPGHPNTGPTNTEYRLEVQHGTNPWRPTISFSMVPIYQQDLEVLNFYIIHCPAKFFHRHITLTKFIKDGYMLLVDDLLIFRVNGVKTSSIPLLTEAERKDAFKKYFNVSITAQEHLPSEYGSMNAIIDNI
ncbi:hypothetical protein DSO57_1006692 [Entomophthora muscae]|uniref:Uncharacterized protein n=1 Tax=Entomophthora muscae TaxID=34485 RepID=A0ACC2UHF8_9FUNG|nr:hypothetical protein DSO57_1006692 [Entomophthora muscae]